MRTAYKAWAGVFAGVFLIVASCDAGRDDTSDGAGPAPFNRTGTVTGFTNPANLTLADGRRIHVPMLNGVDAVNSTVSACDEQVADDTVRALLSGRTVTLTAPPRTRDAKSLVPAGHVEADVDLGGADYARTFEQQYTIASVQRCHQPPPSTYAEPPPSSSDSGTYVDSDDNTNHRDGAFTGGYCSKKRWC